VGIDTGMTFATWDVSQIPSHIPSAGLVKSAMGSVPKQLLGIVDIYSLVFIEKTEGLSTANNFFFAFFHFRGETNRNR
jgi:hypothetical protein